MDRSTRLLALLAIGLLVVGPFGDDDAGRTQQAVVDHVAVLENAEHRSWLVFAVRGLHNGLVALRVEFALQRLDAADAEPLERSFEHAFGCPHAFAQARVPRFSELLCG